MMPGKSGGANDKDSEQHARCLPHPCPIGKGLDESVAVANQS